MRRLLDTSSTQSYVIASVVVVCSIFAVMFCFVLLNIAMRHQYFNARAVEKERVEEQQARSYITNSLYHEQNSRGGGGGGGGGERRKEGIQMSVEVV